MAMIPYPMKTERTPEVSGDDRVHEAIDEFRERLTHWNDHLQRRRDIRALVKGHWGSVFPTDLTSAEDLPMVANIFRVNIEDIGALFAEQVPTTRVDRATERDLHRAEDREKALMAYDNLSSMWDWAEYFGEDMAAVGFTAIRTWPNMADDPSMRFPVHERLDPMMVLPERSFQLHRASDEVMVYYTESVKRLQQEFPEDMGELLGRLARNQVSTFAADGFLMDPDRPATSTPDQLTVLDYYCSDYIRRIALVDDGHTADGQVLIDIDNVTGCCPVQLAYRPTWTNEPLGQMDDSKGIVRTQNRYFRILLDYFVEMVYGGKLVWNVKNPEARGPGVRYYALGPDARMEAIGPDIPAPIALAMVDQLDQEARTSGIAPRSRQGEVQLNKASAAFLERAQGQLTSVVRKLQRSFAGAKQRANEVAFAQDEAWCDAQKIITGVARGERFRLNYRPSELIRGDHSNRVTYGQRGGVDMATWQILQLQKQGAKNMSRETFLEEDPATEDVARELARLRREGLEEAVAVQMMQSAGPQQLEAIKMYLDGEDVATVAAKLAEAPAATALPGLPGPGAVPGAPSAAGAPTGGAPTPPGPLPPLGLLRGQRANNPLGRR